MKFAAMIGEDGFITFVPNELVLDFEAQGFQVFQDDVECVGLDLGGAVLQEAQQADVMLGDTLMRIPVRDIAHYDEALLGAALVEERYYRLEGWRNVVILTPEQRHELLAAWGQGMDSWTRGAGAERARFVSAMQVMELHQMTVGGAVN